MSKRDRLGRGLGALLGDYMEEEPTAQSQSRLLPVASIAPNPFQPRREFSEEELADLTASIRENGLLQPIVVRPAPRGGAVRWELVAGERRWRATMRLGWREVPATVRDVDDRTLLVLALVENLQRSELSPLEEADGFRRLAEEFSLTQQQIAEVVGRDRSTVANALRLLQLPASVRRLVADGALTAGHARALLGLANEREIAELAREAVENGMSVREVEARVQQGRPRKGRRAARGGGTEGGRDAAVAALEEELQRVLGTEVRIRSSRGARGRIEIPFLDADDFERVFELIARRPAAEVVS
jgi:ParB family transcriptional regulator, chromosome partitioning protein